MKILVTGSSGFIGGNLIETLMKTGHEIIATCRNADRAKKLPWYGRTVFFQYDLNDRKKNIFDYFTRPDLVIHTAWDHLPDYQDEKKSAEYFDNSVHFIDSMINGGLRNIAVTGTCFEYGLKEGCVKENDECKPVTEYAQAKLKVLQYIQDLNISKNFVYKWIRLFYIYGNKDPKRSVIAQLENSVKNREKYFLMSKGDQVRDYLSVKKACEYIANISLQNEVTGIINCCSGIPVSLKKFIDGYMKTNGLKIRLKTGVMPYNLHEPKKIWGDTHKLLKIPDI
jgi:dTDP-6-deoxy-L-talose 4-dehydrogenase (NAD+)